jgi:hypothetical protein
MVWKPVSPKSFAKVWLDIINSHHADNVPGTADVGMYGFKAADGRSIALIDTPGFDDTYRSDTEVLHDVAYFLGQIYEQKVNLAGIIYLHRITDNRVAGSALKNLNMFQALCGKTDLSQVVLATSMWDKLSDDANHQEGVKDETDLRTNYWADMLDLGSQTFRHDNTKASADAIVNYILSLPGNMVLRVQREVIDKGLALEDTDAGRILVQDLLAERAKHEREREDWRRSHEEAVRSGNQKLIETVARKEREHAAKMAQLDQERARNMAVMRQDFARMQEEGERKYARLIDSLEKQVADRTESHEADLRKMEELQRSFDAQLDDMRERHDQGWRDAFEGQKRINDAQMDALRTELEIVKAQGAAMKDRSEKPALISVLQAVAGGGLMAAGVYNGSSAMVASGSGMMTSALGHMAR